MKRQLSGLLEKLKIFILNLASFHYLTLYEDDINLEFIVVDATEPPMQRPKSKENTTGLSDMRIG